MILEVFIFLAASLPLKYLGGKFSSKHLCTSASNFQHLSKLTTISEENVPLEKEKKEKERRNKKTRGTGSENKSNEEGKKKAEGRKGRKEATLIGRLVIPCNKVEY